MSTKVVRGIPTKLDVDKLLETFAQPKENDVICGVKLKKRQGLEKVNTDLRP